MITKTQIEEAIRSCEPKAGYGPLDSTVVDNVSRGALHILIEAAKCARYRPQVAAVEPTSTSQLVLDDEQPYTGSYRSID